MGTKILAALGVIILFIIIRMIMKRIKMTSKEIKYGATKSYKIYHLYGLPYADLGATTYLFIHPKKLILECNNQTYAVDFDQITDVIRASDGAKIEAVLGINVNKESGEFLILEYLSNSGNEVNILILDLSTCFGSDTLTETIRNQLYSRKASNGTIQL